MNPPESYEPQRSSVSRQHPGEILRRVRLERGLSLRELARRIKLSPSHLSKIERGLVNPSVGTLWMVSDELGIPVAELFSEHPTDRPGSVSVQPPSAAVNRLSTADDAQPRQFDPCVDPVNRESIKMAGVEFQRLTPHNDASIEFIEVRHEIGAGDAEAYRHRGREYGLVLQGRLQVEIGFSRYILEPGWSVAFDSSNPHRVLNIGDEPAVAVWAVIGRNDL